MKKHTYTLSYIGFIIVLLMVVLITKNISDMLLIILAALALIATSIYTYSTRNQ